MQRYCSIAIKILASSAPRMLLTFGIMLLKGSHLAFVRGCD
jgi:hypothetical protein